MRTKLETNYVSIKTNVKPNSIVGQSSSEYNIVGVPSLAFHVSSLRCAILRITFSIATDIKHATSFISIPHRFKCDRCIWRSRQLSSNGWIDKYFRKIYPRSQCGKSSKKWHKFQFYLQVILLAAAAKNSTYLWWIIENTNKKLSPRDKIQFWWISHFLFQRILWKNPRKKY